MEIEITYSVDCDICEHTFDTIATREIVGDMVHIDTRNTKCPNCGVITDYSSRYAKDQH